MDRPSISMEIQRKVKVEAGHRCAIPTCKQIPVELHHIVPQSQGGEDTFENLIVLCPNCHARVHKGEIDRKSVKIYKSNLSVLNDRYNAMGRRVLKKFAPEPELEKIPFPTGFEILLEYLLSDGLFESSDEGVHSFNGVPVYKNYRITDLGREFVAKMK